MAIQYLIIAANFRYPTPLGKTSSDKNVKLILPIPTNAYVNQFGGNVQLLNALLAMKELQPALLMEQLSINWNNWGVDLTGLDTAVPASFEVGNGSITNAIFDNIPPDTGIILLEGAYDSFDGVPRIGYWNSFSTNYDDNNIDPCWRLGNDSAVFDGAIGDASDSWQFGSLAQLAQSLVNFALQSQIPNQL